MSNHDNHRRGDKKRTENGPRWESHNPGAGCNSTHVARARAAWKKIKSRARRRYEIFVDELSEYPDVGDLLDHTSPEQAREASKKVRELLR